MSDEDRKIVRVSKNSLAVIEEISEEREISLGEAADQLIATAEKRLRASRKWAKKNGKARAAKKSASPKKAKKAKKPAPAAKANGSAHASA